MTAGELIDFLYESNVRSDLSIEDLANEIDKMSVRLGEWIIAEDIGDCCYRCSNCGFIRDAYVLDVGKYCPQCGVKMEVDDEIDRRRPTNTEN